MPDSRFQKSSEYHASYDEKKKGLRYKGQEGKVVEFDLEKGNYNSSNESKYRVSQQTLPVEFFMNFYGML